MLRTELPKPIKEIDLLEHLFSLENDTNLLTLNEGDTLDFGYDNSTYSFFLCLGVVSLYRKTDDVFLMTINSPFCIGLANIYRSNVSYYIRAETEATLKSLTSSRVLHKISDLNLWKESAKLLSYTLNLYEEIKANERIVINNYDMVKTSLLQLWELPDQIRQKTSLFKYIMERHNISRSSVSKIIHALNKGGYIKTNRGILVNINKIPEFY